MRLGTREVVEEVVERESESELGDDGGEEDCWDGRRV